MIDAKTPPPKPAFPAQAKLAFNGLALEYGMELRTGEEQTEVVRYDNGRVSLAVKYDSKGTKEVKVLFGPIIDPANPYPGVELAEVMRIAGVEEAKEVEHLKVDDPSSMPQVLEVLAGLLRAHAEPFLRCDPGAYRKLAEARSAETAAIGLRIKLARARELADAAWQKKNHAEVARILSEISEHLTPEEREKLEWCREKSR